MGLQRIFGFSIVSFISIFKQVRDVAVFVSLSIRRRADQAGGVIVSPGRLPSVCAALLGFSPMEARSSVG
jgi:hypothetical protein